MTSAAGAGPGLLALVVAVLALAGTLAVEWSRRRSARDLEELKHRLGVRHGTRNPEPRSKIG